MSRLKIINLKEIKQQLGLVAVSQLTDLIEVVIEAESFAIANLFREHLQRTDVYSALTGQHGEYDQDLLAHLGLQEGEADNFLDAAVDAISNTIAISTVRGRGSKGSFSSFEDAVTASFRIDFVDVEYALLKLPQAKHDSKKDNGGVNIDWVRILFFGGETIDGYDILFLNDVSNTKVRSLLESKYSRSGRAIMYASKNKSWSTNYYPIFKEADGLIGEILLSAEFANDLQNLIDREINARV